MSDALLTLRAIARELGVPESTARYYRDVFAPYLPMTGRGRRRRYPPEAVALFREIAEGFARNRTRDEIETTLAVRGRPEPVETSPSTASVVPHGAWSGVGGDGTGELLGIVLDGERERREVMWQMAREIVRLGEAIERQHVVLGQLADRVEQRADRTLPPPVVTPPDNGTGLDEELVRLREELQRERELVDRLRKSKLAIERRAAEAEAALADSETPAQGGIFRGRFKRSDG